MGMLANVLNKESNAATKPSPSNARAGDGADIADSLPHVSALQAIVDDLNFGIVVLDPDRRVQFANRAFRRFWRVPDEMIESRPTFIKLMYHDRGMEAYAVSHELLGDYVAKQLAMIRVGEEGPLNLQLRNGDVLQFRCKALPDGGRLLTYGNVSELVHQAEVLEQLACVDALTGLNNRRHFLVLAENEWRRFLRYGQPSGFLMIDIDLFKSVNDKYGHDVGDKVLNAVADVVLKNKRWSDIAGRLGGEEFALMLPETTLDRSIVAAERFRQLVADRVVSVGDHRVSVTVSIGVSGCHPDVHGVDQLIKHADLALYEAKHTGRNRVCRFEPGLQTQAASPAQLP
jgi:diguanylate cyclase (GGDEF)-like protein